MHLCQLSFENETKYVGEISSIVSSDSRISKVKGIRNVHKDMDITGAAILCQILYCVLKISCNYKQKTTLSLICHHYHRKFKSCKGMDDILVKFNFNNSDELNI